MKKSDKYFMDFFDKKKDDISFITLKTGANIKLGENVYTTKEELPIPLRVESLINEIKEQDKHDGITLSNIIDGIIYTIGTDAEFEYNNEYLNIFITLKFEVLDAYWKT